MIGDGEETPEEKLLRVIQKGEEPAAGPTAAPVTLGDDTDGEAVSSGRRSTSLVSASAVMRLLMLGAILLTAGAAYEIYANIPAPAPPVIPPDAEFLEDANEAELAFLGDTLDMYDQRRIFGRLGEQSTPIDPNDDRTWAGWRAYIRDNFKQMGSSSVTKTDGDGQKRTVRESIVMDRKKNIMHFLTPGQTLVITTDDVSEEVSVESIMSDEIVFMSGETRMTFKK